MTVWIRSFRGTFALAAWVVCCFPAGAVLDRSTLRAPVTVSITCKESGVRLALADLARDCHKVLGGESVIGTGEAGDVAVRIDPTLPSPQGWRTEITAKNVRISGADELGAVYAMINVNNIREHVLDTQAATEIMVTHEGWDPVRFLERFTPPVLQPCYRAFLDSFVKVDANSIMQDGYLVSITDELRRSLGAGNKTQEKSPKYARFAKPLRESLAQLDQVIQDYPADRLTPAEREFYDVNLLLQAKVLHGLYQYLEALLRASENRSALAETEKALAVVIEERQRAEARKWVNWYRSDKKMNLPRWLEETRKLEEKGDVN